MKTSRTRTDLAVVFLYLTLTVLMTYPLILDFTTHVPGTLDIYQNLWNLWWVKKAVIDLHTTPYHTDYLFYPTGVDLTFHTLSLYNTLFSIPLLGLMNLTTAYNIIVVLSFVLSGYGAYLLTRYLAGDEKSAFIAGLIFMFSPYRFAHILGGQMNCFSTQFIPFYVLYLIKTRKEGGRWNAAAAAVFLFLTSLCDWHYMCFALIFTALYVFYVWWFEKGLDAKLLWEYAAMAAVFGVLILPFAYPLIEKSLSSNYGSTAVGWSLVFSADVFSYLTPAIWHPLLGQYTKGIFGRLTGNVYETTLFVGFTSMLLFAYYVKERTRLLRWLSERADKAKAVLRNRANVFKLGVVVLALLILYYPFFRLRFEFYILLTCWVLALLLLYYATKDRAFDFWTLAAVVFFVLSLGPFLHVYGVIIPLPLPYLVFPYLPILSALRDPVRFGVVVVLCLSVIAAYSLKELSKRTERKNLFFAAVSLVVLFEFLAAPLFLTDLGAPKFYSDLADTREEVALLEVPIPRTDASSTVALYFQTIHEKRVVSGSIAMYPKDVMAFSQNTPVVQGFMYPLLLSDYHGTHMQVTKNAYFRPDPAYDELMNGFFYGRNASYFSHDGPMYSIRGSAGGSALLNLSQDYPQGDIVEQNISRIGAYVLRYYGITYVVVHDNMLSEAKKAAVDRLLSDVFWDSEPVYSGEGIRAYRVPEADPASFAVVGDNWYLKEPFESTATRWMSDNATLKLIRTEGGVYDVVFYVRGVDAGRRLQVYLNGEQAGDYPVDADYSRIEVGGLRLAAGENILMFHSPEGCVMQRNDMMAIDEGEERCVSMAFRNVTITPSRSLL